MFAPPTSTPIGAVEISLPPNYRRTYADRGTVLFRKLAATILLFMLAPGVSLVKLGSKVALSNRYLEEKATQSKRLIANYNNDQFTTQKGAEL